MFNNNDNEDIKKDLHLADSDYRHLNLPKHEHVSLKEVIAQMQQSTLQPPTDENASLFPFHINLVQADVAAVNPPVTPETSQDVAVQNNATQTEIDIEEEIIEESDDPFPEDPGVMLLPDTIHEVIKIEILRETDAGNVNLEDDGSQELYRIYHNNNGFVQDQPRDLGIPPIEYPPQKLFVPFIPAQTSVIEPEKECCSTQVEIKLTTKLIYLGDYCCGYGGEEQYISNYSWESGCGCECEPYNPPCPPTPNYTIIFNNCDGEQWLDITICNSYGESGRGSFNIAENANYDDCCTTYRVDIPTSFGLDCDCPIVELKTDQIFIYSIYDLIYSNTQLFDCHGNCYEITTPYSSSGTFIVTELEASSSQFVLESCECNQDIETTPINHSCDEESVASSYSLIFATEYRDINNDNTKDYIINFELQNSDGVSGTASFVVDPNAGIHCPCLINQYVYDESQWMQYVNDVTDYGSQELTFQQAFDFIVRNGFFEDCQGNAYEIGEVNLSSEVLLGIVPATDIEQIELNVTFASDCCDIYNRFENWVTNVAPGSFDPFQFFTDNVHFNLVSLNNTSFIEVNYLDINQSLGDGYYTTTEQTLHINLPDGFCVDDFNEVVVDPKTIYQSYQDSCYQFGYDIENVLYDLLDNGGVHVVNTKTGAEYVSIYDDCSGDTLVQAICTEAICTSPVNPVCQTDGEEQLFTNLQASFNESGYGCCSGECNTEYSYQTACGLVSFSFDFQQTQYDDRVVFNYTFTDDTYIYQNIDTSIAIYASNNGLGCSNPLENFVFDESDFQTYLNNICNSLESGSSIEASVVLDYFSNNGSFEDSKGNCFEIYREQENGDFPWVLQACTDCTHVPITVSIDDTCNQEMLYTAQAVNEVTDADKLAYFQNLYTLNYVDCNDANFVEFTYFYNNSEEGCQYNSFPACCETIRISIEDCCSCGASEGGGEEGSSLITQLVLDCDFINDFFNTHFTDYCGNISYNIPQSWGNDFLNYLIDSQSEFRTEDGTSYLLNKDECGNYVIPSDCETCCIDVPVNIALTNEISSPYVRFFPFSTPITATYTHVVGVNPAVYEANLVIDARSEAGDYHNIFTNDFNFNFTYTHCDVDNDGTIDNYLTFTFENDYSFERTGSGSFTSSSPTDLSLIEISAPQNNGDCCDFVLNFDEKAFADVLILRGFQVNPQLDANAVLDTLINKGGASFTDCDDNQYVIVKIGNNYSLQANASGPVIFDLTGDGFNLSTVKQGVLYDVVGDSAKEKTAWIGAGNGLLVYDADQNHTVSDASEFILTDHVPGAKTDLEALRIGFDTNHDNVFDKQDAAWSLFGIWQDVNKDAIVDNGEYHTLAQLGIVSIGLSSEQDSSQMINGNTIHGVTSFTWADGSTGKAADVSLNYNDIVQDIHNNTSVTDPAVSNPTVAETHVAQNDPVVQAAVEQLANQVGVASA